MHSIFLRIFLLFWLAMALIVGSSILTTFTIASRDNEPLEMQRRPPVAIQASEILGRGGIGGLKTWLETNRNVGDRELFVVGPDGRDILGRHLPAGAAHRLELAHTALPGWTPTRRPSPRPDWTR